MTEHYKETTPRRPTRQPTVRPGSGKHRFRAGTTGATLVFAVLLGGCAALHSPVDERPTLRGGSSSSSSSGSELDAQDQATSPDTETDNASPADGNGDNGIDSDGADADGSVPAAKDPRPRIRPVPTTTSRETPSRGSDSRPDADQDDSPDFRVYRDDDRRKTCGELDHELAQLRGQSTAPTNESGAAVEPPASTGIISRLMDSSVVSGIRSTLTGVPSDDDQRETAIRQRIEWLRELKAEKTCYATQPLF